MDFGKCILSCAHHYSILQNDFTALQFPCALPTQLFPPPFPKPATTDLFNVSAALPSSDCHEIGSPSI